MSHTVDGANVTSNYTDDQNYFMLDEQRDALEKLSKYYREKYGY
jgi:hypothetical protein